MNKANGTHGQGTHSTKMGADIPAENMYPKCLKTFQAKMSAQAQKFETSEKSSLWVSVVRGTDQNVMFTR